MAVFKNKQRGSWLCKVYYTDWTGTRKQKKKEGFATKRAALDWEREFLNSCRTDCDITFGNFYEKYISHCKARLKPTTCKNKMYLAENKILPFFRNMKLKDIKPDTLRTWQDSLITHEKGYSPTYLKYVNNQMSAMLNFAVKNDYIQSNPMHKCGSIGKKHADGISFWTIDEFKKFLSAIGGNLLDEALFRLLFFSGARVGEILALTYEDFDFEKNTMEISKSYSRLGGNDLILPPKTPKSNRVVTLPSHTMNAVKSYADNLCNRKAGQRLFLCTKNHITHQLCRGCALSGVKKIRVHDIRHSHASLLIEMGFQPLVVSERLGHENIQTTLQTYSHLYPNKQQEVARVLENMGM